MKPLLLLAAFAVQDAPADIPKADWPAKAHCVVCEANGGGHGEEKPAAGLRYKGVAYYFCNAKEVAVFKADPEGFMAPVLPRPAPAFSLTDTAGNKWDAEAMKGKLILLDFWATWCVPCKEMKPLVEKVRAKYAEKGFEVLSVSIDEKKDVLEKFLTKNKFSNPVLHDSAQVWSAWKVRVVPTFFLVKEGQIVDQWSGKRTEKQMNEMAETWLRSQ